MDIPTESIIIHQEAQSAQIHWHPRPELLYQVYGHSRVTVGKETFTLAPQDILMINAYTIHDHGQENGHLARLQLNMPQLVRTLGISPSQNFLCNSTLDTGTDYTLLRRAVAQFELLSLQNASANLCTAAAYQVVLLLMDSFATQEQKNASTPVLTHLQSAITYMEQHFQEPLTVRQIAADCHLSEAHLAHLFSQELGVTPSGYLKAMRLDYALRLLGSGNLRVSEIAAAAGFEEARRLNTAFRDRFGMLPKEWRARQTEHKDDLRLPESTLSTLKLRLHDAAAQTPPVQALSLPDVNVRQPGIPIPHGLSQLLCVGQFAHLLDEAYREQIGKLQKRFQFKTALISNPFVARVLPWIQGPHGYQWDFTVIDNVLDFLLSLDLKPMLSLSCIPDVFSDADSPRFGNAACGLPLDMGQWLQFVRDFFIHLDKRFGTDALSQWLCSVWTLQTSVSEKINEFYLESCRIIRHTCPGLPLGSPNIQNTANPETLNLLDDFLEFCKNRQWQPDFYLFYSYPVRTLPAAPGSTFQDTLFANGTRYIHDMCRHVQTVSQRPVYIGWNSSQSGCGDYFNDTAYKAANLIPALLDISGQVQAVGYSVPVDTSFLNVETSDFDGSFGLITRHGLPKAAYFAYGFLLQLKGIILLRTDNLCVTRIGKTIQVLCWHNQNIAYRIRRSLTKHNSLNYLRQPMVLRSDEDTPFWPDTSDRHAMLDPTQLSLRLSLTHMAPGQYRLMEAYVNDDHGCAYNNWLKMGAPSLDDPDDLEYIARITMPMRKVQEITVDDSYVLQHLLAPNEIYMATVQPRI